ncbi:MAG: hypothetical protein IIX15_05230 [Clostridia bacterium]|nr:hypothetical protein [Clostridia bacterium]
MNFKIRVAELNIAVSCRGTLAERICRPYMTSDARTDLRIFTTGADVARKQRELPIGLSDEQAECIALHEQLSLRLADHDAFVLHAALISYKGKGYAVVAPRGGGKTTHARFWQSAFGDEVRIINGDKPIVRLQKDGSFRAYGTPWCGKEGLGENASVSLCGICFISKGQKDSARKISEREYVDLLIGNVVFPADQGAMSRGAKLLARLIRTVPAVAAEGTMTEHAAEAVRNAMLTKE